MPQAVLVYRDPYIEENIFRRLQGRILSITPVYVQRDDHAKGLFHLLTLAARILTLGDYTAKKALAQDNAELAGICPGNPKRTPGRLRRWLARVTFSDLVLPEQGRIRKKASVTDHLPKGFQGHRRSKQPVPT